MSSQMDYALAKVMRFSLGNELFCSNLDSEVVSLLAEAWRRVESSGAVASRVLEGEDDTTVTISAGHEAAAAEGAVRGLHACALAGCTAKEVHVSQFKKCGACMQAAYCCREHQLADWPAHKAACKAARKKAAESSSK